VLILQLGLACCTGAVLVMVFYSGDIWVKQEEGKAGAVSEMAVPETKGPITRSEMQWQPV